MKSTIYTKEKFVAVIEMSSDELMLLSNVLTSVEVSDQIKNDKTWKSFVSLFSEVAVVDRAYP